MQIEFRIEDTTRPDPLTVYTAVIRATPEAVIDMPAMAGMPPFTETAHAEGTPGDYGIHPTFAHGGEFRLRLTIQPGAIAEFPLTVLDTCRPPQAPAAALHSGTDHRSQEAQSRRTRRIPPHRARPRQPQRPRRPPSTSCTKSSCT